MTLPGVVVLLLIFLAGWSALAAKVRLTDAAGLAARAAARGEPQESIARDTMPAGATISVHRDGDLVRVTVRQRVSLGPLPSITLREEATALAEPESNDP
ncbi:TadE family type IV pilus minor pilin [Dactylosporangium sp. NPDC005555]|uniref:TadE family type IV pilus minor pilin n=1 Tax=Dactylosporangium sp. NPDC005555 TaxID=3154889 RepID=UPI0033A96DBE